MNVRRVPWTAGLISTILIATCTAQVPLLIPYENRISDVGVLPPNGSIAIQFDLFTDPDNGTPLCGSTNIALAQNGCFATFINEFPTNGDLTLALTNPAVFLRVIVDGTELNPRERLASAPYAIVALNIATGAVTSAGIADGAVHLVHLGSDIVLGSAGLEPGSVTGTHLQDGTVSNSDLAADAVSGDNIVDGSISNADLAAEAVDSDNLARGAVHLDHLGSDIHLGSAGLEPGSVTGTHLQDGTVSNSDLAADAVSGDNIVDGSISNADLAAEAVHSLNVINGSISNIDLSADAVTTEKIADGTVTRNDVASNLFWSTEGNSDIEATRHFLGTTDNRSFEARVDNRRAMLYRPTDPPSLIGGDESNTADNSAPGAFIGGGAGNRVVGASDTFLVRQGTELSPYAVIAGGHQNTIGRDTTAASIAGGEGNTIGQIAARTVSGDGLISGIPSRRPPAAAPSSYSTIAGGRSNTISSGSVSVFIGGGHSNKVGKGATSAMVPGGEDNAVGDNAAYAFAAGRHAQANHRGAFVWADSQSERFASTRRDEFCVRASGGVTFVTGILAADGVALSGAELPAGEGAWNSLCDVNAKENFSDVDSDAILTGVANLPLHEWNYKNQNENIRHVGPTAQDFRAAFGLGTDARHISTIDADGISMAAIQALYRENEDLKRRLATLESTVRDLQAR